MRTAKLATYDTRELEQNILNVYNRATDSDIATGKQWYATARDIAANLCPDDMHKGAGILAAYSPMCSWKQNVESAFESVRSHRFNGHMFPANNRKARKIFDGKEPLDVLGGNKVRAFYSCIISGGKCEEVCIDRHAQDVCIGRTQTDEERKQITSKWYRTYSTAYRNVSRRVGHTAAELQAIVWVAWRREKGMVD